MTVIKRKKRLNITLSEKMNELLEILSSKDNIPMATKAVNLLQQSIDQEEDRLWSDLAEKRHNDTKKWITHDLAWTDV